MVSSLVKDLLIDWRSGAGAGPYFRIFNPVTQGNKFDPEGDYVRRWVPELARLLFRYIHSAWTISSESLKEVQINLGETYSEPMIDHSFARDRALMAFSASKS